MELEFLDRSEQSSGPAAAARCGCSVCGGGSSGLQAAWYDQAFAAMPSGVSAAGLTIQPRPPGSVVENSGKALISGYSLNRIADELGGPDGKTVLYSERGGDGLPHKAGPAFVTYSFPDALPAYIEPNATEPLTTLQTFRTYSEAEKAITRAALKQISDASNIVFFEITDAKTGTKTFANGANPVTLDVSAGRADMVFLKIDFTSRPNTETGGFAVYPGGGFGDPGGSDVYVHGKGTESAVGSYLMLHEILHAVGLKHPHDLSKALDTKYVLSDAEDRVAHTVMSYTRGETWGTGEVLGKYDKAALKLLYGEKLASVPHTWNPTTQTLTQRGTDAADIIVGVSTNDNIDAGAGNDRIRIGRGAGTVTGGDGDDHVHFVVSDGRIRIDGGAGADTLVGMLSEASPAAFTVSDLDIKGFETITFDARWSAKAVTFTGGSAGEKLLASKHGDTFTGGGGGDAFEMGAGKDTMVVKSAAHSPAQTAQQVADGVVSFDTIGMFTAGQDKIDLSAFKLTGFKIENLDWGTTITGRAGDVKVQVNVFRAEGSAHLTRDDLLLHKDTVGNDTLVGGDGKDLFEVGDGNDTLIGNGGADELRGLGGDDTLQGGAGRDFLDGGDGKDTFVFKAGSDSTGGFAGADHVWAFTRGQDVIDLTAFPLTDFAMKPYGDWGTEITGKHGGADFYLVVPTTGLTVGRDSTVDVKVHADTRLDTAKNGTDAADTIAGDSDNNTITGGAGRDSLSGEAGNDVLSTGADGADLWGGTGADRLIVDGANTADRFTLDAGSYRTDPKLESSRTADTDVDTVVIGAAANSTQASWGYVQHFKVGQDRIDLSAFKLDDFRITQAPATPTYGGHSIIEGTGADGSKFKLHIDRPGVTAGRGDDWGAGYTVKVHAETKLATSKSYGPGDGDHTGDGDHNTMLGEAGDDTLSGMDGNDVLDPGTGRTKENLWGGAGADTLYASDVENYIDLGADKDADRVVYRNASDAGNRSWPHDLVGNFEKGRDKIDLSAFVLTEFEVVANGADTLIKGKSGTTTFSLYVFGSGGSLTWGPGSAADVKVHWQTTNAGAVQQKGYVKDGYVAGATVYRDTDSDGTLDADEDWAITDGTGAYELPPGGTGPIRAFGGVNIDTGLPNLMELSAPDGAAMIDPLTTLVQTIVAGGASVAEANARVRTALGLSPDLDFGAVDVIAEANGGDPAALSAHKAAVSIATIVAVSAANASTGSAVFASLAGRITSVPSPIDLASRTELAGIFADAGLGAAAGAAAASAAATNRSIAGATGLEGISAAQKNGALVGNALDNTLMGGEAADRIDGRGGADRMTGGRNDDRYIVDHVGDATVELAGGGVDVVRASVDYVLSDHVEMLDLVGAARRGTGNDGANRIAGTRGDDTLLGMGGPDRLFGFGGDDLLVGGDGEDRLTGGAGGDTLTGGAGRDVFGFAAGDLGADAASSDVVTDFDRNDRDVIDLRSFDAVEGTPGLERFRFLGTGAFTGSAGELRYSAADGVTLLQGDTDGDRIADMVLTLSGEHQLVRADLMGIVA